MKNTSPIIIDHYGNLKFWLYIGSIPNVPYILDFEDEEVRDNLINPDEVVITDEKIMMNITYPLSAEVNIPLEKKGGFTRMDVFKSIYKAYKRIYEEEEKDVGDPGSYDNLYNRRKSEGKYRIWGHYIDDLLIESVSYDQKTKILYMFIGS